MRKSLSIALALVATLLLASAGKCDPPGPGPAQVPAPAATPKQQIVPRNILAYVRVSWSAANRRLHLPIDIHWDGAAHGTGAGDTHENGHYDTPDFLLAPTRQVTVDAHQTEPGFLSCQVYIKDDGHGGTATGMYRQADAVHWDWISCVVVNNVPVD